MILYCIIKYFSYFISQLQYEKAFIVQKYYLHFVFQYVVFIGLIFFLFKVTKFESMSQVKAQEQKQKKVYTYQDLIKFSNTEIYSAFGEMKESKKNTAPQFSFGTSTRDAEPKKFVSKEMAVVDCFGKQTPKGPNYNVTDKFNYSKGPQWKIGTNPRNTLDTKAKYEHYFRKDIDLDINQADKIRRQHNGNTRFGGDSRFPPQEKKYKMTPGPEYKPNLRPEIPHQPQFSLYARRAVKGFDPLIQLTSTSEIVGPGSYHPQKSSLTSANQNLPHWSMPKGPRDPSHKNRWQLNQTYDTTSSVGLQTQSEKPSKPLYSIGKQQRGNNKSGIFQAHMEYKPMQIRIDHPKF